MPDLSLEHSLGGTVAGVDEVGRGPLAGPVVACAVILPATFPQETLAQLNDSKKLSAKKRDTLAEILTNHALYGLGQCTVQEIDSLNILQASLLAMRRAVAALPIMADHVLVDGNQCPGLSIPSQLIIGGDQRSASIAAASILAKVTRDRYMQEQAIRYPAYGWEKNAGYGTADHKAALLAHGITPEHRRSFAPIKALAAAGLQKGRACAS